MCNTRNTHTFSKDSYQTGVVLGRCPGCKKLHLIADNLKWFSDDKKNLETILNDRLETYQKLIFVSLPSLIFSLCCNIKSIIRFSNASEFEEAVSQADPVVCQSDGKEKT